MHLPENQSCICPNNQADKVLETSNNAFSPQGCSRPVDLASDPPFQAGFTHKGSLCNQPWPGFEPFSHVPSPNFRFKHHFQCFRTSIVCTQHYMCSRQVLLSPVCSCLMVPPQISVFPMLTQPRWIQINRSSLQPNNSDYVPRPQSKGLHQRSGIDLSLPGSFTHVPSEPETLEPLQLTDLLESEATSTQTEKDGGGLSHIKSDTEGDLDMDFIDFLLSSESNLNILMGDDPPREMLKKTNMEKEETKKSLQSHFLPEYLQDVLEKQSTGTEAIPTGNHLFSGHCLAHSIFSFFPRSILKLQAGNLQERKTQFYKYLQKLMKAASRSLCRS
ncbi:hypothetical protein DNTS_021721 [Danionella cerebrum]|uniref:Uncharacterized protein n=1 Tax=Danionella cerebrum TaxID=2873325 RepID=A0A553NJA3_9TELE|nr:hypothetical protein DNTS_021721 [Danionella translucida]